jgi:glycosyltransferase involved in cell wall biosynthesis
MAAAIGRLLGDEELRLRLASSARERVAERYTPEEYKRSMIVFYEQVLATFHEAPSAGSLPAIR